MASVELKLPASWKTTVSGVLGSLATFVTMYPDGIPHWLLNVAKFIMIGGFAALGLTAKDSNVTGGNTLNTGNDPAVVNASTRPDAKT
jgi:hypothetical protein